MSLKTTTIGAYPKPSCIPVLDWFAEGEMTSSAPTTSYERTIAAMGDEADEIFARGIKEVIDDQVQAGIDIVTDGEVRRENYIHYHCRHLEGFDFQKLSEKAVRGGNYHARLPTVTGPVSAMVRGPGKVIFTGRLVNDCATP